MKPTLLILAAGMGSRYGGLKQVDPIGPNGETILDYSIYDAIRAGFEKVVFIIRESFEESFREKIGSKLQGKIEVAYAYQELDKCLGSFDLPESREKPWGTGHAILCAKDVVDAPFAVINADDFYGKDSYRIIKGHLDSVSAQENSPYAMVGYTLRNTLSEHGTVSRGICDCDENMMLKTVTEMTDIACDGNAAVAKANDGSAINLTGEEIVSMNLWGFDTTIFDHLQKQFAQFLKDSGNELKSEFFIPAVVDTLIKQNEKQAKVLHTNESWFGVTYREDKEAAQQSLKQLIEKGYYPEKLWS